MKSALFREREVALQRGLHYLSSMALFDEEMAPFCSGFLYCCSFMATTASDPVLRRATRELATRGFRQWQEANPTLPAEADASTLNDFVHCHFAAQRLGIRFPKLKRRMCEIAEALPVEELLWFDPRTEPPPANVPENCGCGTASPRGRRKCVNPACRTALTCMTRLRAWCLTLTTAFCGDRLGVRLGASYADALRWLPEMRRERWKDTRGFYDAVYAVTHVVYTLNDYGLHRLSPHWLPYEWEFLRHHLADAIALEDPDMVGEFLDTLRSFGLSEDDAALREGMEFLLACQQLDGSWGPPDAHGYVRLHATWAAMDGLRGFAWRGEGLSFPELLPSLITWARIQY